MFTLTNLQQQSTEKKWTYQWLSASGEVLVSYCYQDSYHWLHFPELANFKITSDGNEISCFPLSEIPIETIHHLLLDQVLPRCLAHKGNIVLHASAVNLGVGLVLFLGDSGVGKSTLAGNFHQAGNPVVSDDCIRIVDTTDRIMAVPSYGGLRLWQDSLQNLYLPEHATSPVSHYASKLRVPLKESISYEEGLPVLALMLLSPPDEIDTSEVNLDPVPHREAFIALLKQSFQLNLMDIGRMKTHAQSLSCIVPRLSVYRLSIRRDFALLPIVRQKILETVLEQQAGKEN